MSDAFLHKGFVIEYDISAPYLRIEGQEEEIKYENGQYISANMPDIRDKDILEFAKNVIENSPAYRRSQEFKKECLEILSKGVSCWNKWRMDKPEIRPLLYGEAFDGDFQHINFSNTVLSDVVFRHSNLTGANFHQATL